MALVAAYTATKIRAISTDGLHLNASIKVLIDLKRGLTALYVGNRKDGVCLQKNGQVSKQPKRCRSAKLDPKARVEHLGVFQVFYR